MARELRVEILGDASRFTQATKEAESSSTQLESTWDRLQRGVDELGQSVDKLSDKVDELDKTGEVADAFGNLERVFIGVADNLGVLEEQFGVPLGPMREYTQAAADVAGGMEGIIAGGSALVGQFKMVAPSLGPAIASTWSYVTALAAQTAAFIAANAPILIIIGSLVLLGAGIYALIKYWDDLKEKFPILQDLQNKVTGVVDAIVPKLKAVWQEGLQPILDFVRDHWVVIGALVLAPFAPLILIAGNAFGIRDKLEGAFQGSLDWMRDTWQAVKGFITAPFDDLMDAARNGFGIPGAVETAFNGLVSTVTGIINTLISAYNNTLGRVPGAPNIGEIGGGGGGSSQGFDPNDPTGQHIGGGGAWEAGYGSSSSNQMRDIGNWNYTDGADQISRGVSWPGGMGTPSIGYQDPRGVTLTANDILNMRNAPDFGYGPSASVVINIGTANMTDQASANLVLTRALKAAGMA